MRLLLCADLHIRDSKPASRKDDYIKAMESKLDQIAAIPHDLLLCAGDVFHSWNASTASVLRFFRLPGMTTVVGNHDARYDNYTDMENTALGLVGCMSSRLRNFKVYNSDSQFLDIDHVRVYIHHHMVYKGEPPYPGCPVNSNVENYMEPLIKTREPHLILTGDNHKTFTHRIGNTVLVNPGSMMRMTIDQKEHKPCVFLFDTITMELRQHFLKIEEDVFHEKIEYNFLLDKFVESVDSVNWNADVDFEKSLMSNRDSLSKGVSKKVSYALKKAKQE